MTPPAAWQHVTRITGYALVIFAAFVLTRLVLIEKMESEPYRDSSRILTTDVEVHSLDVLWGLDLLVVPIVGATIAVAKRKRSAVADVGTALLVGFAIAIGMVYFPSAVMGGHVRWPFRSTHFDPTGFMNLSLTYAIGILAILLIVNRIAARTGTTAEHTRTTS